MTATTLCKDSETDPFDIYTPVKQGCAGLSQPSFPSSLPWSWSTFVCGSHLVMRLTIKWMATFSIWNAFSPSPKSSGLPSLIYSTMMIASSSHILRTLVLNLFSSAFQILGLSLNIREDQGALVKDQGVCLPQVQVTINGKTLETVPLSWQPPLSGSESW